VGGWRGLHNEVFQNLYASQNIIREIESRTMRRAWHAARMEICEMNTTFWLKNGKERDHSEDLVGGRIWEDIRLDLREVVWECVNWMHLAQVRNQ
jgi:hypothetical protein